MQIEVCVNKPVKSLWLNRKQRRTGAVTAAVAVVTSLLVPAAQAQAQPATEQEKTNKTASAPTPFPRPSDPDAPLREAIALAKKQNSPVPVEAVFSETSRTWAYPDGGI
ncbi:hypothetical protein AB0L05_24120 [Nonomuraea pusilla]|uniref:hypothetical protein n=1 Tax=Nonomuraea pusilla TaxID=46177 RepID=UPI00332FA410